MRSEDLDTLKKAEVTGYPAKIQKQELRYIYVVRTYNHLVKMFYTKYIILM